MSLAFHVLRDCQKTFLPSHMIQAFTNMNTRAGSVNAVLTCESGVRFVALCPDCWAFPSYIHIVGELIERL